MAKALDITGQKFGKLTAIKYNGTSATTSGRDWLCHCECGKDVVVPIGRLRSGHTTSCGCYKAESTRAKNFRHGFAARGKQSKAWKIWTGIRKRCYNKNDKRYSRYGGRGIQLCERWQIFNNFLADMGECPPGYSIERINNDGHYEPSNCKWIPHGEQSKNTSSNVLITANGETKRLTEWAKELNTDYRSIASRIKRGWTSVAAVTTPIKRGHKQAQAQN